MRLPTSTFAFCFALLISFASILAADNPDLSRNTPVPDNQPIPVIDFFRPARLETPKLSPSGTRLAALVNQVDDQSDLLVLDLATKQSKTTSAGFYEGEILDISYCRWMNDERLAFGIVAKKQYSFGLYAVDIAKLNAPFPLVLYSAVQLLSLPQNEELRPIVWIRQDVEYRGDEGNVLQLDASKSFMSKGKFAALFAPTLHKYPRPPKGETTAYFVDRQGLPFLAETIVNGEKQLWVLANDKWLGSALDTKRWSLLGCGDKAGEIIVAASPTRGRPKALYRADAVTGSIGEQLYSDPEYNLDQAFLLKTDPHGPIQGLGYNRQTQVSVWFDENMASIQAGLEKALPGKTVRILNADRSGKLFLVDASSDLCPTEYYLFDSAKVALSRITSSRPWIDPARMRPMKSFAFVTRDGFRLEAFITMPAGASKTTPPPLVVYPHGGPFHDDIKTWNPVVQFLASRGYAVLQVNYRGSTGQSWRFTEEQTWEFRKMSDDVSDAVRYLIRSGAVDSKRIAIMGTSFGAYLALSGVVNEADLYRCAVAIAGIYDWEKVLKEAYRYDRTNTRYDSLRKKLGDPKLNREKFEEISPLRHITQVRVPVYVAHGYDDPTAAVEESKRLIAALEANKIPYEKQLVRGEGHGFRKLENQVELFSAIDAFLRKNMSP